MDYVPIPTGRPIVFYSPHQDDETLFMGQVIARHALAAREVHVVLVTDGRASAARHSINGTTGNGWWLDYHYPDREGYAPLTQDAFAAARTGEFRSACGQLGVQPENVHLEGYPDSTLTLTQATAVIEKYEALYPTAGHYTMSWADPTSDHNTLGEALRDLAEADSVAYSDVRWLVKADFASQVGAASYYLPPDIAADVHEMVRRATLPYKAWNPVAGAYACGYHSVGTSFFPDVEAGDPNWIHALPPPFSAKS